MVLFENILFLIIGIYLYFKRPIYSIYFYVLWCTVFSYLCDFIVPMGFQDAYKFPQMALRYIWLCGLVHIILEFTNSNKEKSGKIILTITFFFIFFIVMLGEVRGTLKPLALWLMSYFAFIPLWLIICTEKIDIALYEKYIRWALIIELSLGVMQWAGYGYASFVEQISGNGLRTIAGTFQRYNAYAENLSLLLLSYIMIVVMYDCGSKRIHKYLCLISYIMIFLSGARAQSVAIIFSSALLLFFYIRKKGRRILWLFIAGVFILLIINISFPNHYLARENSESTINRQMEMVSSASDRNFFKESSTLALTFLLLDEYLSDSENILTGPGKLFKSKYGYQGIICVDGVMYDSDLMLYVCETGLVGLFFLSLFVYYIVQSCSLKVVSISFVSFLLFVSVTDFGLFEGRGAVYMFLAINFINQIRFRQLLPVEK